MRDLVVHGHFYQPPRENPWTDEVDPEPGARPYRDWNERIHADCYRANAFARVAEEERIVALLDNYERLSFDLGPTLGRWLERHHPGTLRRFVAADRRSAGGGHGNAIAHPYVHAILPLADPLDRATLVRWGLAEFRHRFGRDAEAMWLPETAADNATLGTLVDHGLRFAILAPEQAARVRPAGDDAWLDVAGGRVDPSRPYRWLHPDGSGRSLALFFYDGPLAQSVAFGDALHDGPRLLAALERAAARGGPLVHLAVDGETAGHHQRWGDRTLAWVLFHAAPGSGFRVTGYGEHLERHSPEWDVELALGPLGEGTSWSCPHGVGRWLRDCGCRYAHPGWSQAWRGPLRAALDLLRDRGRDFYLDAAGDLVRDPWRARDEWIEVLLDPGPEPRQRFHRREGWAGLDGAEVDRLDALLAMQRHLLLMYSSCGWFFDDVAGLEAQLLLRQAARAIELWRAAGGAPPLEDFTALLAEARSNQAAQGTGADVFRRCALHRRRPTVAIAATPAEQAAAPLMATLRRWLDGPPATRQAEAGAALRLLAELQAPDAGADLRAAQELVWLRLLDPEPPLDAALPAAPPLAVEIAQALGFAPPATARLQATTVGGAAPLPGGVERP